MGNSHTLYCSFCGKNQHEVRQLVAGPGNFICNECIDLCHDIMHDRDMAKNKQNAELSQLGELGEITAIQSLWLQLAGKLNDWLALRRNPVEKREIGFGEHEADIIELDPSWAEGAATSEDGGNDDVGFVFTALWPEDTGLPVKLWIGDDNRS
jgi:hypothetical protein